MEMVSEPFFLKRVKTAASGMVEENRSHITNAYATPLSETARLETRGMDLNLHPSGREPEPKIGAAILRI